MLLHLVLFSLILFARASSWFIQIIGKGSGTAIPGWLVEMKFPFILSLLNHRYKEVIFISGTNGKTTTRSALVTIYETQGKTVNTNRGGANIMRGLAASLLLDQGLFSPKPKSEVLILEVEEATLPKLTKYIQPDTLILTNIFRDQLDAYGEIDKTLDFFRQTLAICESHKTKLYINADDDKLLGSVVNFKGEIYGFSLELDATQQMLYEKSEKIEIPFVHLYKATNTEKGFQVKLDTQRFFPSHLPGRYNIYNLLVATIVGFHTFGSDIKDSLDAIKPVFGRGEVVTIGEVDLIIMLIKNPSGFNEVLNFIKQENASNPFGIAFLINDNIADGRDVSWLWDVDIESCSSLNTLEKIYTSGTRGQDMLLRLEYAGFPVKTKCYISEYKRLIHKIKYSKIKKWYILSTYTALLDFRNQLGTHVNIESISSKGN